MNRVLRHNGTGCNSRLYSTHHRRFEQAGHLGELPPGMEGSVLMAVLMVVLTIYGRALLFRFRLHTPF
jgi:hypothetical protein